VRGGGNAGRYLKVKVTGKPRKGKKSLHTHLDTHTHPPVHIKSDSDSEIHIHTEK